MTVRLREILTLECFPPLPENVAVPADASDDYAFALVKHEKAGLIINDRHGALACALPSWQVFNDSASAARSLNHNLNLNGLPAYDMRRLSSLESCISQPVVVLKIPKNREQLHYWLNQLARVTPQSTIVMTGMAKHIPIALLNWLEENSDEYEQLPIIRKARAIRVRGWQSPPLSEWVGYELSDGVRVGALPGVFCRGQLDLGARAFLEFLAPESLQGPLLDLGCGNGVLSVAVKNANPEMDVHAVDDSAAAVLSTAENAKRLGLDISVSQSDSLTDVSVSFSTIICNPPFHDGHLQLTNIAQRMFEDSRNHLLPGGRLYVIANRHLPYLALLKKSFSRVLTRPAGAKFVVYVCER